MTTVGIDDERRRRLATRAARRAGLQNQSVLQQALGDVGYRCGCQSRRQGEIGQGYRPAHTNGMQRYTLVVIAGTLEIRSGQDAPVQSVSHGVLAASRQSAATASEPSCPAPLPRPGGT